MIEEKAASIYESGEYAEKNPGWHIEHSEWKAQHALRMLKRNGIRPGTICEVGCGVGEILACMKERFPATYTGFEISPLACRLARERHGRAIEFNLGSLETRPDMKYDLVMALDVFEHVEDYLGFLTGIRDCGQWKLFHIPLDISCLSVLRPFSLRMARERVGHLHFFTRETALSSLTHCGYRIIDTSYTAVELELPYPGMKRANVIRRALSKIAPDFTADLLGGFSLLVLAQ